MNAKWKPAVLAIAWRWLEMLPVLIQIQVVVVYGNGRMLSLGEIWNGVLESSTEVRILGRAAVTGPPCGVDG